MSRNIFTSVDTGMKVYRSRFNLSYRHTTTCDFAQLIPIMAKFCLPGDVWKCGANILARYQPMLSPSFTRSWIKMRFFFVPLRLIEKTFEQVVTGSNDGQLVTRPGALRNFLDGIDPLSRYVRKNSFWDYLGIPCMNFNLLTDTEKSFLPADYWFKAYKRIWWDYFRDENLSPTNDLDFEVWYNNAIRSTGFESVETCNLKKDYFTSTLPWQLKGVAPTFSITAPEGSIGYVNFNQILANDIGTDYPVVASQLASGSSVLQTSDHNAEHTTVLSNALTDNDVIINRDLAAFNVSDLRTMFAQTRVFERLARCGSRYTEYLRANFNISPSDGTLQRAQYLGGFKQPIVCTEIPQTAQDGDNAVGTLRGKGISSGSGSIKPYVVKEFGVIFAILSVMPEISYTQGIPREYTYKERFDFFNPSFQNLSEQEVRNGELFVGIDGKNNDPFGYQGLYNELRISHNLNTSEMRDTLAFWNQGIHFAARPNLDANFLNGNTYNDHNSFHKPFAVQDKPPIIIDCMNLLDVYRPMVRRPVPGLIDHN